jgi:AraC-like DNA-binding protein
MHRGSSLASAINRHIPGDGQHATLIPGLTLNSRPEPMKRTPGIYSPSICVVAQGCKRMYYGDYSHTYHCDSYLISSVTLPAEAEIFDVSPERPFLALCLAVDRPTVSRLMFEMDVATPPMEMPGESGICVSSPMTDRLKDTFLRLLNLLDDPLDTAILAPGLLHELHYEVLRGPHGHLLRNCVLNDARANRVAPIIHFIEENFHRALDIDSIARFAGMSPSSLHQHFKHATSMSPMQFIKSLRLHNARTLLLSGNPANTAAFEVGYSSPSQFSREFKRFFGELPSQVRPTSEVIPYRTTVS